MMKQQSLSDGARQAFYDSLQAPQRPRRTTATKAAVIAACLCLLLPLTAFAVEIISGRSITEIFAAGYQVDHPEAYSRPLSDFPEEIRQAEQYELKTYGSWAEAEEELGVTLLSNAILSGDGVRKLTCFDLSYDGISGNRHCFAYYNGKSGQFYRATLTAAYEYRAAQVVVRSTVTAEHPEISAEDAYRLHWTSVQYDGADVAGITQEPYTAESGIRTDIVRVEWTSGHPAEYAACFFANGASYKITVSCHDPQNDAEGRAILTEILNAFVF